MKWLVVILLLCGCSRDVPVSETIAENAINALNAIEQGLSVECKTDSVITNFVIAKGEVRNVRKACELEKEKINQERLKWMWGFWGLLIAVGGYIIRKILK